LFEDIIKNIRKDIKKYETAINYLIQIWTILMYVLEKTLIIMWIDYTKHNEINPIPNILSGKKLYKKQKKNWFFYIELCMYYFFIILTMHIELLGMFIEVLFKIIFRI